jgi:hypothetical protein
MRKGFPAFEWWADPPQDVLIRVYVFNVTNYEQFMNGTHLKLHVQEVGPYIFRYAYFTALQQHILSIGTERLLPLNEKPSIHWLRAVGTDNLELPSVFAPCNTSVAVAF